MQIETESIILTGDLTVCNTWCTSCHSRSSRGCCSPAVRLGTKYGRLQWPIIEDATVVQRIIFVVIFSRYLATDTVDIEPNFETPAIIARML